VLFILAGGMYVFGALGMEVIEAAYDSAVSGEDFIYLLMVTVEETLEKDVELLTEIRDLLRRTGMAAYTRYPYPDAAKLIAHLQSRWGWSGVVAAARKGVLSAGDLRLRGAVSAMERWLWRGPNQAHVDEVVREPAEAEVTELREEDR
jgi:hypothetical protein